MAFVIRGVQMFLGWAPEDEADGVCGPLRRITHLCGLTFGGEDATEEGAVRRDRVSQKRQPVQRIRLATVEGQLVQVDDRPIDSVGGAQGFDEKGRGAL